METKNIVWVAVALVTVLGFMFIGTRVGATGHPLGTPPPTGTPPPNGTDTPTPTPTPTTTPTATPTPEVSNKPSIGDDLQTTNCTDLDALTEEQALGDCGVSKVEPVVEASEAAQKPQEVQTVKEELVVFPTTGGFLWF